MQKFEKKTGFHERRKTSLDINNSTSTNSTPASATKTIITPSTSGISITRTNDKVKLFLKKVMHLLKKRNKVCKLPFPCQNQAGNENNSSCFYQIPHYSSFCIWMKIDISIFQELISSSRCSFCNNRS